MIKEGSLKSDILEIIKIYGDSSCAEICNVLRMKNVTADSDTVSSIIYKMVAEKVLAIHEAKKASRGGKVYTLGQKSQTKKLVFKFKI